MTERRAMATKPKHNLALCAKCGRPARWLWLGNNYEPPEFCCGYHKRGYLSVLLYSPPNQPAIDKEFKQEEA